MWTYSSFPLRDGESVVLQGSQTHEQNHHLSFCFPHIFSLNGSLPLSPSTSCPSSFPPLLPLFILPLLCPSSSTYLILFADSSQPLVPQFLKEKELKLAREMNNVPAISSGVDGSVFSCMWRWKDEVQTGWWWGWLYLEFFSSFFLTLLRLQWRKIGKKRLITSNSSRKENNSFISCMWA